MTLRPRTFFPASSLRRESARSAPLDAWVRPLGDRQIQHPAAEMARDFPEVQILS